MFNDLSVILHYESLTMPCQNAFYSDNLNQKMALDDNCRPRYSSQSWSFMFCKEFCDKKPFLFKGNCLVNKKLEWSNVLCTLFEILRTICSNFSLVLYKVVWNNTTINVLCNRGKLRAVKQYCCVFITHKNN